MSIVIVGCGGLGREVAANLARTQSGRGWADLYFWEEAGLGEAPNKRFRRPTCDDLVHVAIGDNSARERLMSPCLRPHDDACGVAYVGDREVQHKSPAFGVDGWLDVTAATAVFIGKHERGHGCYFAPNCTVGPDVVIGDGVIVDVMASVAHDCVLESFSRLAPHANLCGGVTVGRGAEIGASAVVLPRRTIGARATVGAGAVVTKDVPPGEIWAGNPARRI